MGTHWGFEGNMLGTQRKNEKNPDAKSGACGL
jgi:hypothetical protein